MGANRFATMVQRNTNRMTLILVYALLEWVLIVLLLFNALFSYLIVKFADYFGLKSPCPLCSRIDHLLSPKKGKSFYRDLLCEDHVSEVSKVSYCLNHRKLTDSMAMCGDCSCSSGLRQEKIGEMGLECLCSCCGLRFGLDEEFGDGIEKGNDHGMDLEDLFKAGDIHGSNGFQHLEYFLGKDGFNLIPIELIDPTTDEEHLDTKQEVDLVFEPGLVVYNRSFSFDEKRRDPSAFVESSKLVIQEGVEIQGTAANDDDNDDDGNQTVMAAAICEEKEKDPSGDMESTKIVILDRLDIQENENLIVFNSENYDDQEKLDGAGHQTAMSAAMEKEEDDEPIKLMIQENENIVCNCENYDDRDNLDDFGHRSAMSAAMEKEEDEPIKLMILDRMEIQENGINCEKYDHDNLDDVGHQAAMVAETEKEEDESTKLVILDRMVIQENEVKPIVFNPENYDHDNLDDVGHQAAMVAATEEEEDQPIKLMILSKMEVQENEINPIVSNSENYYHDNLDDLGHQAAMTAATEKEEDEPTKLLILHRKEIQENENNPIVSISETYVDKDKLETTMAAAPEEDENEEDEDDEDEEFPHMTINETEADVSIGTDIPDLASSSSSSNSENSHGEKDQDDHDEYEEHTIELKPISVELTDQHFYQDNIHDLTNIQSNLISSDINNHDEEKIPETPTSTNSFLQHEAFSNAEGVDGITSVDRLKAALRSERKALYDLYIELEEERSASAVAANQTMAMINRLQEEKAAMQMEALQYQRMMEEQSEYDQEALQLLNELMVKKEREKQHVEKELEVYRKRVHEYESKKKIKRLSSSSIDGLSLDPNQETPFEEVFDGDRVQMLEHIKVLEEKLFSLGDNHDDEDEQYMFEENGYGHEEGRLMGTKGKRLLPLFNAISDENGDENGYGSSSSEKRIEVDEIYKRVQALEDDGEFLKQCISSLKKGDEGMDLLREILQHLRDLRTLNQSLNNISKD